MDERSKDRLKEVDSKLAQVVELAYYTSPIKFKVTEGIRTKERQEELVKKKLSKTMKSKHLTGRAVDVAAIVNGSISWDMKYYKEIAIYMKRAAEQLGVKIECGADWGWDGPHIELKG